MDSGWIVAGSSLATIVATGLFSIWSKRIDAKQKVDEHKLAIRSVYITKKMNACQIFLARNNVRVNTILSDINFFEHYLIDKKQNPDLLSHSKALQEVLNGYTSNISDSIELYFDFSSIPEIHNRLVDSINSSRRIINSNISDFNDDTASALKAMILDLKSLVNLFSNMNKLVRDDIRKYDIV